MPAAYLQLKPLIKKYFPQKPSKEWILPSLQELIAKVRFILSVSEYVFTSAPRWQKEDEKGFNKALRYICRRVLELRLEGRDENDINETIGRHERKWEWDVIGTWALVGIAIMLTQCPPLPRGRPKAREEYPIEEIRRMKDEGISVREIATRIGISKSTIHRLLSRPTK